eukprot:TRINITY_DN31637_c0_g1_i1.p1 TRINITY_DN31637_c0_g1~~TRINITY_DN31637_c0_g1_i1.p1  ORF type:complete len:675 (+),score=123.50 TRINITY_DN31637_c0_g1_i1:141-2165(+)
MTDALAIDGLAHTLSLRTQSDGSMPMPVGVQKLDNKKKKKKKDAFYEDSLPKQRLRPRPSCRLGYTARFALLAVGLAALIVGIIYLSMAAEELNVFAKAVRGNCKIEAFQIDYDNGMPYNSMCEEAQKPTFRVRLTSLDGELIFVNNYMPQYATTSSTGVSVQPIDPPFKCCPQTTKDYCSSYDLTVQAYCDDFGTWAGPTCPLGTWECYVTQIASDDVLYNGDFVREAEGEHLQLGTPDGALQQLAISLPIVVVGLILVLIAAGLRCRHIRRYCCCCCVCCPGGADEDDGENSYSGPAWLDLEQQYNVRDDRAAQEYEDQIAWVMQKLDTDELFPMDPGAKPGPSSVLLPDTGDLATCRRLVQSRVISEPGDERERVLMAVEAAQVPVLVECLRVEYLEDDSEEKATVFHPPAPGRGPRWLFSIEEGYILTQVGEIQWPENDAETLLSALATGIETRVIFEGERSEGSIAALSTTARDAFVPQWLIDEAFKEKQQETTNAFSAAALAMKLKRAMTLRRNQGKRTHTGSKGSGSGMASRYGSRRGSRETREDSKQGGRKPSVASRQGTNRGDHGSKDSRPPSKRSASSGARAGSRLSEASAGDTPAQPEAPHGPGSRRGSRDSGGGSKKMGPLEKMIARTQVEPFQEQRRSASRPEEATAAGPKREFRRPSLPF